MLVTLYTNASLINNEIIEELKKYNIHKISVSIYSDNAIIHDEITQIKGSFEKTMKSIKALKQNNFIVELKTVVLAENYSRLKCMRKLANDMNMNFIADFGLCGKINGDCSVYKHKVSNEIIKEIFYSDPDFYCGKEINYNIVNPNSIPCGAGKYSFYCSADGYIYPCVSFRYEICRYDELQNIKNNKKLIEWNKIRIKDFSDCFKHNYCKYCLEQCAGNNLIENGNYLNSNTSHCERAKIIYQWFSQHKLLEGGEKNEKA